MQPALASAPSYQLYKTTEQLNRRAVIAATAFDAQRRILPIGLQCRDLGSCEAVLKFGALVHPLQILEHLRKVGPELAKTMRGRLGLAKRNENCSTPCEIRQHTYSDLSKTEPSTAEKIISISESVNPVSEPLEARRLPWLTPSAACWPHSSQAVQPSANCISPATRTAFIYIYYIISVP